MGLILFITENKRAVKVLDDLLKLYLVNTDVIIAPNGPAAVASITPAQPLSAIIIDQEEKLSLENIRDIRARNIKYPIIFVSSDIASFKDRAMDAGATKTLEKPFFFNDLVPVLNDVIAEYESVDKGCFDIEEVEFYPTNRILYRPDDKKMVNLTEKETAIIKFLYQKKGRFVDKDTLLREVWQYENAEEISTHTLETHIYRLRGKFEEFGKTSIIVTDAGGYKLDLE